MNIFNLVLIESFLILSATLTTIAHEGHHKEQPIVAHQDKESMARINERYLVDVKPIFQKKCFDCHSSKTQFPWYSIIPGPRQLIQHDIEKAHEHLDMDADFPFKSHAEPLEDLEAINETISKDEMPPWRYRILHRGSALTMEEKEVVHRWVQFGKDLLNSK
jgi:uncharacterized membrane protein